jgi:hypothetical protein
MSDFGFWILGFGFWVLRSRIALPWLMTNEKGQMTNFAGGGIGNKKGSLALPL